MKASIGILFFAIVYIDTAHGISIRDFFGWLKKSSTSNKGATASRCIIFKNRRKCKLDTNSFNLDSDKAIELTVSTSGRKIKCSKTFNKGQMHWHGSCDGDADDANFIARFDENGKKSIHGSIHVGNEICQIGPNIFGDEEILCIPKSDFLAEDSPKSIPKEDDAGSLRALFSDTHFGFTPSLPNIESQSSLRGKDHNNEVRRLFDDSGGNIDVMVVWTKLAECRRAGLAPGCIVTSSTENLMRGLIDLAIAETNTAFALSGIFSSLRLVHAYREPDYVEGEDFYTSLDHITTPNDGFMDSVHSKRALYGADVVTLLGGAGTSCGIAWSGNPSIDYMFSVTQYSCATGYYTFGHEIGHNLGMFHDRGTEKTCSDTTTFNYGYRDPSADFRTILAYDCKMGECDSMPKNGCTRVQRFSNSDSKYTYNGKPIGDSRRDNAKQINNVRALVAGYFPAMNCRVDSECNDRNSTTTDTCNTANGVCVFTPSGAPTKAPIRAPTTAPIRAPTTAPIPAPTTAPSTRAPVTTVTKLPTLVPSRAPIPTVLPSQKPVLGTTPTKAPIIAISPPVQPTLETFQPVPSVSTPAPTSIPTPSPSTPVGSPPFTPTTLQPTPTSVVPVLAPITVVDEPIEGQEQKGFFAKIFDFFGGFLLRLLGRN